MNGVSKKADSQEIKTFLEELASQSWLRRDARKWWPKFVFHYTDIRNAVETLKSNKLICRQTLEDKRRMLVDNASPAVIQNTGNSVKEYVRLYFRPKTPTQYSNEGIRPFQMLKYGAHCPVPVFFLFDSAEILTRVGSCFSDGNLASSQYRFGNDAGFLRALPFNKIYHTGYFDTHQNNDLIFHRNAEVIVPKELDLSALRYILCRSPAERDSFLHLLPTRVWDNWYKKIFVEGRLVLFERRWTFVERVDLSEKGVTFHFSPDTKTPGPFKLYFELIDTNNGQKHSLIKENFYTNSHQKWEVQVPEEVSSYSVKLKLDENLAYANEFFHSDIPF